MHQSGSDLILAATHRDDHTPMRILLTGDLHIGRASSRVPESVPRAVLRAATAWGRIVDLAIAEQVTVVCLSGDIVDSANRFWEAIGPLERGIARLTEAGMRTVAVAGNHDFEVLARLADQLPSQSFTLLGRGGRWERLTVDVPGQSGLHLDGWSFPTSRVRDSPLGSYDLPHDSAVPTLGIVHGDLDVAATTYAPLSLAHLQACQVDGWLLGHTHAPRLITGRPWVLYPGSPQALDPGEPGSHGPWIVEVADGQLREPEQRHLSSVWYERRDIDLSGTEDDTELDSRLLAGIRAEGARIAALAGPHLVHTSLRLSLTGSTSMSQHVAEAAEKLRDDLDLTEGTASVAVEKVDVQTTPAIDLAEYARANSAPGAVARLLLQLDTPDPSDEVMDLVREARREVERVELHKAYVGLEQRAVTEDMARGHVRTQARALLTALVSQTS